MQYPHRAFYFILYCLFIVSGLTGLVYEVAWSRLLSTILGNTFLAISIVVSVFLLGLAVGSFAGSKAVGARNPLKIYALLELSIGIYAALTPRLVSIVEPMHRAWTPDASEALGSIIFSKSLIAAMILFLPATAMGATFPILVKAFPAEIRKSAAALLYGLNTAGAMAGTVLAGYFLLPAFGISKTIYLAALLNFLVCIVALLIRRPFLEPTATEDITKSRVRIFRPLYLLAFFTGFTLLSYEILWTRALTMYVGSSVYAFATILTTFLLGIAWGSSSYSNALSNQTDPYLFYSLVQFRISLSALFFIAIFMMIPGLLILLLRTLHGSFALYQIAQFVLIGVLTFYAAFLSGAAFPAALHFVSEAPEKMQAYAGHFYAYSTIGSVLGAIASGFFLIPVLGVERSIRLIALTNLILGILCFRRTAPALQSRRVLAIGGICLVLLILLPRWNRSIYNGGYYAFAYKYARGASPGLPMLGGKTESLNLLYYDEGLVATVAVVDRAGTRTLLLNGKPEASNAGEMRTQLLLAHLPGLLFPTAQDVLVIGLGSGITAGGFTLHKNIKRIDSVEIEGKVMQAARYFETENRGILTRPEFHVAIDDARNLIQTSRQSYDIITSEPSNLWMSGAANLFTREFFLKARQRLKPNGIFCQWIHLYQISLHDVLIFLKTFHTAFPHVSLWIDQSDLLVAGSTAPLALPGVIPEKIDENLGMAGITNLLRLYAGDEASIVRLTSNQDVPLNTDDHPILEFTAPKSIFRNDSAAIREAILTAAH